MKKNMLWSIDIVFNLVYSLFYMSDELVGAALFARYLPSLFVNDATQGGKLGFKPSYIGPIPRGSEGLDMQGALFAGNSLRFEADDDKTILTFFDFNSDAPISKLNKSRLVRYLANPEELYDNSRPKKDIFSQGVYHSPNSIVLRTQDDSNINCDEGNLDALWESYKFHVAKPLHRVLWPL